MNKIITASYEFSGIALIIALFVMYWVITP